MSPFNATPEVESGRRRVLFFAEAVTLAHVARPLVLAQSLDSALYQICFACDPRYDKLLNGLPFERKSISSISSERFLAALAKGSPVYDLDALRSYVQEDLEVIRGFNPDLIVGDFRLSLSVSARLAKIPYVAISNAYWSPYARQKFPMPDLPMIRYLGLRLSQAIFKLARPIAFALHTVPMNRLRKENGLPSIGWDLRKIYTDGDYTLYADIPELVPTCNLPPNHQYIGPILWSAPVSIPEWWNDLPSDKPLVYVTLGSSGNSDLLPLLLEALGNLPVNVIAATAGRVVPKRIPKNCWLADFVSGEAAASRSSLVICNGGSPSTHQALAAGTPVLGICSNLDQFLNMQRIQSQGAGLVIRAGKYTSRGFIAAVSAILLEHSYRKAAETANAAFRRNQATDRFKRIVSRLLRLQLGNELSLAKNIGKQNEWVR